MKVFQGLVIGSLGCVLACASNSGGGSTPTDPGLDPGQGQTLEQRNMNPDGVAYPTAGIGITARKGNIRGSVIQNFRFFGYANNAPGDQPTKVVDKLGTVALADFYDPTNKRYKLLHLIVAAVWCKPCNDETDALVPQYADLAKNGVVVIQGLSDGPDQTKGATKLDLDGWITRHKTNFTQFLDPSVRQLGPMFNNAAVPFNAYIDVRSMEILYALAGSIDPLTQSQEWLDWIQNHKATTY